MLDFPPSHNRSVVYSATPKLHISFSSSQHNRMASAGYKKIGCRVFLGSRLVLFLLFYFFICSRRWFESRASDDAMFSFWTSIPSGTTRCTGAKFQMARMPLFTSRSHISCALDAGTVIMPCGRSSQAGLSGRPSCLGTRWVLRRDRTLRLY